MVSGWCGDGPRHQFISTMHFETFERWRKLLARAGGVRSPHVEWTVEI